MLSQRDHRVAALKGKSLRDLDLHVKNSLPVSFVLCTLLRDMSTLW